MQIHIISVRYEFIIITILNIIIIIISSSSSRLLLLLLLKLISKYAKSVKKKASTAQ
jgi:hypothetical protein